MNWISRRTFVVRAGTTLATLPLAGQALGAGPIHPAADALQAGDLLWPKQPGVFIPYSGSGGGPDADQLAWEAEKNKELARLAKNLNVNTIPLHSQLSNLSYAAFRQRYFNGVAIGQYVEYASGGVAAVGHVGVVDIGADGVPHVVDANPDPGVATNSYDKWIEDRPDHVFWHGRLRSRTAAERAALASAASAQIGKPYDFWNFNLADPAGFYCSKLVWLAAYEALGLSLDGDPDPQRSFWLSPKQLLGSADVEILLDQGDYMWD